MSAEIQQQEAPEQPSAVAEVNTAVAEFDRVAAGIGALKERYAGVVFDVATTAGMKAACEARAAIRAPRYEVEKVRKAVKAPLLKLGKDVDARAAQITADLLAIEEPVHLQISTEEARKETERKARLEAEQRRVAAINADIEQDLRCVPTAMVGRPAADIDRTIRDVVAIEITAERFGEFAQLAAAVKESTLSKLREMHARQVTHEAEQERLRLEREELARQRAAQEEANRLERERQHKQAAIERDIDACIRNIPASVFGRSASDIEYTIDEVEHIEITMQRFGEFTVRAQVAKGESLARLREMYAAQLATEREQDRQREEQRKLDEQRQAQQAEQRRIAEENARQAEELQRQREELAEAERLHAQSLAAAEAERQQREAAEHLTSPAPAPMTNAEIERIVEQHPDASIEARDFQPTAEDLIALVACNYGVGPDMAAKWLRDAFAPVGAA